MQYTQWSIFDELWCESLAIIISIQYTGWWIADVFWWKRLWGNNEINTIIQNTGWWTADVFWWKGCGEIMRSILLNTEYWMTNSRQILVERLWRKSEFALSSRWIHSHLTLPHPQLNLIEVSKNILGKKYMEWYAFCGTYLIWEERELHFANRLKGRSLLQCGRILHRHWLISNLSNSNLKQFNSKKSNVS